jgi:hypothetical protein
MFLNDLYRGFGTNLPVAGNVWGCYPFVNQSCYPFTGQQFSYGINPWVAQSQQFGVNPISWGQQLPYGITTPFVANNMIGNSPLTNPVLAQSGFYGYTPFHAFNTLNTLNTLGQVNPSVFPTTCR